jgi:hypothetical protein
LALLGFTKRSRPTSSQIAWPCSASQNVRGSRLRRSLGLGWTGNATGKCDWKMHWKMRLENATGKCDWKMRLENANASTGRF